MSKSRIILTALILSSPNGCAGHAASQTNDCAQFLSDIKNSIDNKVTTYDIEKEYGIKDGLFVEPYEAMKSINSGCTPSGIASVPPTESKQPWDAPGHIDTSSGVHKESAWIQFVYPSIDSEYGPGLSSSIVFYDTQGKAISTKHVSSYHAWEGAKVSSSRFTGSMLERCTQTVEFYSYNESGDMEEVLQTPTRSACEYSYGSLPE